jgi:hypothetical protein
MGLGKKAGIKADAAGIGIPASDISARYQSAPEPEQKHPSIEVQGEGLIRCDTITNSSRQSSLVFVIESVKFVQAYHCVGF